MTKTRNRRILKSFGPFNRYALVEFKTRFDTLEWFIEDAETRSDDGTGLPAILFQTDDADAAIARCNAIEASHAQDVDGWEFA